MCDADVHISTITFLLIKRSFSGGIVLFLGGIPGAGRFIWAYVCSVVTHGRPKLPLSLVFS